MWRPRFLRRDRALRCVQGRRPRFRGESLEPRLPLAADATDPLPPEESAPAWQNPIDAHDVTNDGMLTPLDVLVLLNDLNASGTRELPNPPPAEVTHYLDVNGDQFISPADVIAVINELNAGSLDTTSPTVEISPLGSAVLREPVAAVEIVFSEPVTGLDLTDFNLDLAFDSNGNLLADLSFSEQVTLRQVDSTHWILEGLSERTAAEGAYNLRLSAAGSGIQDEAGNPLEAKANLLWELETTPPTGGFTTLLPDTVATPISEIVVAFSEPVLGLRADDFRLERDGAVISLEHATLISADGETWTLGNLPLPTAPDGNYTLTILSGAEGPTDAAGNPLAADISLEWTAQGIVLLPGDTDLNGRVDLSDFTVMKANFGVGTTWAEGDVDGNGRIDLADFTLLLENLSES